MENCCFSQFKEIREIEDKKYFLNEILVHIPEQNSEFIVDIFSKKNE